jgi:hypothetical protein
MNVELLVGWDFIRRNRSNKRKPVSMPICPSNPIWPDLGSNSGRHSGNPACNLLSCSMSVLQVLCWTISKIHLLYATFLELILQRFQLIGFVISTCMYIRMFCKSHVSCCLNTDLGYHGKNCWDLTRWMNISYVASLSSFLFQGIVSILWVLIIFLFRLCE